MIIAGRSVNPSFVYTRNNSIKSLWLQAQVKLDSLDLRYKSGQCTKSCACMLSCSAVRAAETTTFVCLRMRCSRVTEVGEPTVRFVGPALKAAMQHYSGLMDVILLYVFYYDRLKHIAPICT
jgi:hypothetical protein